MKYIPLISVVIPVKNEAKKIEACIEGILSQTIPVKEIIVIDSGSTDGTQQLVNKYDKTRLIEIPGSEFNHGATRNLGVSQATGEYILFTVGDAKAVDIYWIENLLKGFTDDSVAAVCGQQVVPHEKDKNPVDWFRPQSVPSIKKIRVEEPEAFEKMSPVDKKNVCGWDDVTALYKRSALLSVPFQRITYGEDGLWAKEALKNGMAIVYNYNARVYHYHLENAEFTFKRAFTTMYFRYTQFGFIPEKPESGFKWKLRTFKTIFKSVSPDMKAFMNWYRYNTNNLKAINKAYKLFMRSVAQGEEVLHAAHEKYCGKPPVPVK